MRDPLDGVLRSRFGLRSSPRPAGTRHRVPMLVWAGVLSLLATCSPHRATLPPVQTAAPVAPAPVETASLTPVETVPRAPLETVTLATAATARRWPLTLPSFQCRGTLPGPLACREPRRAASTRGRCRLEAVAADVEMTAQRSRNRTETRLSWRLPPTGAGDAESALLTASGDPSFARNARYTVWLATASGLLLQRESHLWWVPANGRAERVEGPVPGDLGEPGSWDLPTVLDAMVLPDGRAALLFWWRSSSFPLVNVGLVVLGPDGSRQQARRWEVDRGRYTSWSYHPALAYDATSVGVAIVDIDAGVVRVYRAEDSTEGGVLTRPLPDTPSLEWCPAESQPGSLVIQVLGGFTGTSFSGFGGGAASGGTRSRLELRSDRACLRAFSPQIGWQRCGGEQRILSLEPREAPAEREFTGQVWVNNGLIPMACEMLPEPDHTPARQRISLTRIGATD